MPDRWSPADRELVAAAIASRTAYILAEIDGLRGYADDYLAGMRRAAEIATGDTDAC